MILALGLLEASKKASGMVRMMKLPIKGADETTICVCFGAFFVHLVS